jgi:hypothetical protein
MHNIPTNELPRLLKKAIFDHETRGMDLRGWHINQAMCVGVILKFITPDD